MSRCYKLWSSIVVLYNWTNIVLSSEVVNTNRFVFKIEENNLEFVKQRLEGEYFFFKEMIVPTIYVFERRGKSSNETEDLELLKQKLDGKIEEAEQVIEEFEDPIIPVQHVSHEDDESQTTEDCDTYSDMGVRKAWAEGLSGKGVVIAVTDVGVNTNIADILPSIDARLQFNFVKNTTDVTPERFPSYRAASPVSDHGNMCSGLLAATKDNKICGDGIAFGATLAALKIFEIIEYTWSIRKASDIMAHGLSFKPSEIDIYSNSWGPITPFHGLGLAMRNVIEHNSEHGRNRKGSIYVFPAGPIGDGYANSNYTVTVNGMGPNGTIRLYTEQCAAVLTSAYGEGSQQEHRSMRTLKFPDLCTRDFRGTSVATAIVSGIIALALERNSELTLRDIQHLIVKSSEHKGFVETNNFTPNGADLHFHRMFGFGLLNASKLSTLAQDWKSVSRVTSQRASNNTHCSVRQQTICTSEVTIDCHTVTECVNKVEHVIVTLSFKSNRKEETKLVLISPAETQSILIDVGQLDAGETIPDTVELMSVHFWGESPKGVWKLEMAQSKGEFSFHSFTIVVHGSVVETAETDENTTVLGIQDVSMPVTKVQHVEAPNDKQHINITLIIEITIPVIAVIALIALIIIIRVFVIKRTTNRRTNDSLTMSLLLKQEDELDNLVENGDSENAHNQDNATMENIPDN